MGLRSRGISLGEAGDEECSDGQERQRQHEELRQAAVFFLRGFDLLRPPHVLVVAAVVAALGSGCACAALCRRDSLLSCFFPNHDSSFLLTSRDYTRF